MKRLPEPVTEKDREFAQYLLDGLKVRRERQAAGEEPLVEDAVSLTGGASKPHSFSDHDRV